MEPCFVRSRMARSSAFLSSAASTTSDRIGLISGSLQTTGIDPVLDDVSLHGCWYQTRRGPLRTQQSPHRRRRYGVGLLYEVYDDTCIAFRTNPSGKFCNKDVTDKWQSRVDHERRQVKQLVTITPGLYLGQ